MDIQGKTMVLTGAGGGLGQAVAQRLAAAGAHMALVDINQDNLARVQATCEQAGGRASSYTVDVTDESAVEQLFDDITRDLGPIDGLVNNAGITRDGLLIKAKEGRVTDKMSADHWDQVINLDLRSVFLCAREAAVKMVEKSTDHSPGGVIVNISSISRAGNAGQTNYAAAKAGVSAMTTTWAAELARHQIRVAAIAPGFCSTSMVNGMREDIVDKIKAGIPLGRLGEPEEIAQTVHFIMQNDFVNGRTLEIDGGMRL